MQTTQTPSGSSSLLTSPCTVRWGWLDGLLTTCPGMPMHSTHTRYYHVCNAHALALADLPEEVTALVKEEGLDALESSIRVGYDYWPAAAVLKVPGRMWACGECRGKCLLAC